MVGTVVGGFGGDYGGGYGGAMVKGAMAITDIETGNRILTWIET